MSERFDALVIGGGPGGAVAALLLARAGWSVALLERKKFPRRKVCGEYLSATNLPLFDHLGIGELFRHTAGPEVRRVGLFAGTALLEADLCRPPVREGGRALGREHLDTLLLARAAEAGVCVRQPCTALELNGKAGAYRCWAASQASGATVEIDTPVVIAAHGSWEPGPLPTQVPRCPPRASDLFGFKAHFSGSALAEGLMPLLAFPGGYGGMVQCDAGRVSLSCCIRRDRLAALRQPGEEAGEAALRHIRASCRGVDNALAGARREGAWLGAGPIQPGIRVRGRGGLFPVGNAAGEAHPVVAEGISMAMQSAWLVTEHLVNWRKQPRLRTSLAKVATGYARDWRRHFAPRLYAAAALAHWAMWPTVVAGTLPLLYRLPKVLTWGAHLTGKATRVVRL